MNAAIQQHQIFAKKDFTIQNLIKQAAQNVKVVKIAAKKEKSKNEIAKLEIIAQIQQYQNCVHRVNLMVLLTRVHASHAQKVLSVQKAAPSSQLRVQLGLLVQVRIWLVAKIVQKTETVPS